VARQMPQVPLDLLASCERGHVCDIKKRWADRLAYLAAGANEAAGKHAAGKEVGVPESRSANDGTNRVKNACKSTTLH